MRKRIIQLLRFLANFLERNESLSLLKSDNFNPYRTIDTELVEENTRGINDITTKDVKQMLEVAEEELTLAEKLNRDLVKNKAIKEAEFNEKCELEAASSIKLLLEKIKENAYAGIYNHPIPWEGADIVERYFEKEKFKVKLEKIRSNRICRNIIISWENI